MKNQKWITAVLKSLNSHEQHTLGLDSMTGEWADKLMAVGNYEEAEIFVCSARGAVQEIDFKNRRPETDDERDARIARAKDAREAQIWEFISGAAAMRANHELPGKANREARKVRVEELLNTSAWTAAQRAIFEKTYLA